ncbi:hypothetical protein VPHD479_0109 [Vibrio phage D479]
MTSWDLQQLVEKAGFDYDRSPNEYNEDRYQVLEGTQVVYESYNVYCVAAWLEGFKAGQLS